MKRISFGLTQDQIHDRSKTVTRRLGWRALKAGMLLQAVDRVMGFRPGQKAVKLAVVRVTSVWRERLDSITYAEVSAEGFPGKDAAWFVEMFCRAMKCEPSTEVTRIEFEYVDETP